MPNGRFADHTNTSYAEVRPIIDALPAYPLHRIKLSFHAALGMSAMGGKRTLTEGAH